MILATNNGRYSIMLARRKNVWYSVQDGNWSDPNTWLSNALDKKLLTVPQVGDDVYINHSVTLDNNSTPSTSIYNVNNCYISGKLMWGISSQFNVNGNLQATGTLDMSANNAQLYLNGYINSITTLINHATNSYVYYSAPTYCQDILPLTYSNLVLEVKQPNTSNVSLNQIGDVTCYNLTLSYVPPGNFANSTWEINGHNITVNHNCLITAPATIKNSINSGSFLIVGDITVSTSGVNFNFPANYTIEVRGGVGNQGPFSGWNTTNALTIWYTTNNQNITLSTNNWRSSSTNNFNHKIDGVTVTLVSGTLDTKGWIDGTNGSSIFVNKATINYQNTQSVMNTAGTMDCSTYTNTFNYNGTSAQTIKNINYYNLTISASAKTLAADLIVGNNFTTDQSSTLNTNGFNFTVTGTTTIIGGSSPWSITSSNNVIFIGALLISSSGLTLTGTATIECRGGITASGTSPATVLTSPFNFTTNNQSINSGTGGIMFNNPVTIAAGLIITTTNTGSNPIQFNSTVTGGSGTSEWNNTGLVNYQSATAPMVTGKLYCNQTTNTFIYGASGNQDVQAPSDPTPGYKNLTLQGSGAKTLLGNVSVKGTYTLTGPATLNSNGFALTNP